MNGFFTEQSDGTIVRVLPSNAAQCVDVVPPLPGTTVTSGDMCSQSWYSQSVELFTANLGW